MKDTTYQVSPSGGTIAFDDDSILRRCRNGDMQAFGTVVAKYQDRLFNAVFRMVGRHADAEELSQEAFVRAMERLSQFRAHSSFYTWLFRIAVNLVCSQRRRNGCIKFQPLHAGEETGGTQADNLTAEMAEKRNPGPETAAMSADVDRKVSQALDELDEQHRIVVVLHDIEQLDYRHIAEALSLPVGTVKSRLHRARRMLKDKLANLV